ncbi:ATP-binding protein [Cupriavidus pauculus]|uniref:ORC1/DEAH AAA+ ATPase domain-containing protein n=1 Tax=Cupriavidus pauculus TaxID=82633 RepID=A0A2N5C3Q2_9BURK|nr:ATP-binding protein [Cupriavidus pauculus]PLP96838.1 hypothetical protein CYJ10_30055 [Cupriavidus pauculus]
MKPSSFDYKEFWSTHYGSNSFLRLLDPLLGMESFDSNFSIYPEFSSDERLLLDSYRFVAISRLDTFFQKLDRHYPVVDTMHRMITEGYIERVKLGLHYHNKDRIAWFRKNPDFYEYAAPKDLYIAPTSAPMASLFGISGLGKTFTIQNILHRIRPWVVHRDGSLQLTYVYTQCSPDGRLTGMLRNVIQKIGDSVGHPYISELSAKPSIEQLEAKAYKVIDKHNVGILVIDEFQNCLSQRGVAQRSITNYFVNLNNTTPTPVFIAATPQGEEPLQIALHSARRSAKYGSIEWNLPALDAHWNNFMTALWPYQWTRVYVELTFEFIVLFHNFSQGIYGIAICLFQLSQIRAITSGKECLTPELVTEVYYSELHMVTKILDSIRTRDKRQANNYSDVIGDVIFSIKEKVKQYAANSAKIGENTEDEQYQEASQYIADSFPDLAASIMPHLEAVYNQAPSLRASALVHKAHNLYLAQGGPPRRRSIAQRAKDSSGPDGR